MEKLAILAILEAKPGKEEQVKQLLTNARELAIAESGTVSWYAFRISEAQFGIFDTFADEAGRQAHLSGALVGALLAQAPDLFSVSPDVRTAGLLAIK